MPFQRDLVRIETLTKRGRALRIREMRWSDVAGILACLRDPRFRLPYLTGTPDPVRKPPRKFWRAWDYVAKAYVSGRFGRWLFGARRHWIMAIEDAESRAFLGVVMLDAVVRSSSHARGARWLEALKRRTDQPIGAGEWGFFLLPAFWREGIATQSVYALSAALATTPSWCAPGRMILSSVWAETPASNVATRRLLEKLGLVLDPAQGIRADESPRFDPDGTPLALVHYKQAADNPSILSLLQRLEAENLVNPHWRRI